MKKNKSVSYPFYWESEVTTIQTLHFLEKSAFLTSTWGKTLKVFYLARGNQ